MLKNPFRYPIKVWEPKENISQSSEIKHIWKNKIVPPHLQDTILAALTYYPELSSTYIIVVETKFYGIQHSLRSYPPLLSLLNKRDSRVYPIVINTNKKIPNSFYKLTPEEQQGVLAHEFAHTLDYTNRTSIQIASYAIYWLSKKFVEKIEHATDRTAISRGCGKNLFCYRKRTLETVTPKLRKYLEATYLKPEEIVTEELQSTSSTEKNASNSKKPKTINSIFYGVITTASFIPAITQMMYLIWIRKMHKKPDWYKTTLESSN
jgi:hypothetical protein